MSLIIRSEGSLFDNIDKVDAIVNPVNCVGVSGRGLAYAFRKRFPENYAFYIRKCQLHHVMVGLVTVFPQPEGKNPRYIINFPSKRHWRDDSHLEDIEATLGGMGHEIFTKSIRSLAMPAVGCGLGGLQWRDVLPLIEFVSDKTPEVEWIVYEPQEMREARAAAAEAIGRAR